MMYHGTSSRDGFKKLRARDDGPKEADEFEVGLDADDTCEQSQMERERLARINDLQKQLDDLKKNRSGPKRKKASCDSRNGLPCDEIVIKMLERENELRLSAGAQKRFEEAEASGSTTDWIEVASEIQKEVLTEFNVPETALHAYRCAANKHGVSLYVKYNRAREGDLRVGSQAPDVPLVLINSDGSTSSQTILGVQQKDRPLVLVAGSLVSLLT